MNNVSVNLIYLIIIQTSLVHLILTTYAADIHVQMTNTLRNFNNSDLNDTVNGVQVLGPFTCKANISFSHCQFRVDKEEVFDLIADTNITRRQLGYISYEGNDLEKGECGVLIKGNRFSTAGAHLIECRVRIKDDCEWKYASTALFSTASHVLQVHTDTKKQVVYPGGMTNLIFKSTKNIGFSECSFKIHDWGEWNMLTDDTTQDANKNFSYFGEGLSLGECGVTMHNVTDDMNGLIWFKFKHESQNNVSEGVDYIQLIVAKVPDNTPYIQANLTMNSNGKHILQATCSVTGIRPAPSINWYFGGLLNNNQSANTFDCVVDDDWTWPYGNHTTKQTLERKLGPKTAIWTKKHVWCTIQNGYYNITSTKIKMSEIGAPSNEDDTNIIKEETSWQATYTLLVVVIVLLFIIIISGATAFLIFAYHRGVLCCPPLHMDQASVNHRQIPSPATSSVEDAFSLRQRGREPIPHRTLVSSIDDLYVTSANEYAEIRQSFFDGRIKLDGVYAHSGIEPPDSGYSECMKFNSIYQE